VRSRELEPERCTTGTNRKSTSDSSRESTDRGGKEGQPGRFTFENLDPGIYQIQVVQAL
jgi:hypothetical protein